MNLLEEKMVITVMVQNRKESLPMPLTHRKRKEEGNEKICESMSDSLRPADVGAADVGVAD